MAVLLQEHDKAKPSRDAIDHLWCEEVTDTLGSHEQFSWTEYNEPSVLI